MRELENRVAAVHADLVQQRLQKLNCPSEQKAALLEALIASVKERKKPQTEALPSKSGHTIPV